MTVSEISKAYDKDLQDLYAEILGLRSRTIKKIYDSLAARGITVGTKIKTGHGEGFFISVFTDCGISYRIDAIRKDGKPHGVKCIYDADPDSWEVVK